MIVDVEARTICQIDIDTAEALRILCKILHMDFVLDEDINYFVHKDCYGQNCVYVTQNGHDYEIDNRGDLFVALRNVAVNIVPNLIFRNAEYIYGK